MVQVRHDSCMWRMGMHPGIRSPFYASSLIRIIVCHNQPSQPHSPENNKKQIPPPFLLNYYHSTPWQLLRWLLWGSFEWTSCTVPSLAIVLWRLGSVDCTIFKSLAEENAVACTSAICFSCIPPRLYLNGVLFCLFGNSSRLCSKLPWNSSMECFCRTFLSSYYKWLRRFWGVPTFVTFL